MKLFKEDFESKTMRHVNDKLIIPVCRKEKKSYALSTNECGLKTDVFVSHSWDERFGDFVECIKQAYENKLRKPNLWICAFGLLQGDFEEIKSQLGAGNGALDQSPFVRALKGASNYLVVRNCTTNLCARIWCILEFVYAKEFELIPDRTIVTGPDTFADTNISCCDAKSFDPIDKEKILKELMKKSSVDEINEYIKEFCSFGSSGKTAETEVKTTPAAESVKDEELKKKDEELKKTDEELKKTDEELKKMREESKKKDEELKELNITLATESVNMSSFESVLKIKDEELKMKDKELKMKDEELKMKDEELKKGHEELKMKDEELKELKKQDEALTNAEEKNNRLE